jgi:hypothetical protein
MKKLLFILMTTSASLYCCETPSVPHVDSVIFISKRVRASTEIALRVAGSHVDYCFGLMQEMEAVLENQKNILEDRKNIEAQQKRKIEQLLDQLREQEEQNKRQALELTALRAVVTSHPDMRRQPAPTPTSEKNDSSEEKIKRQKR